MCKNEEKTVKEFKMHIFLVCAQKSRDFAQSQKFFARSHDRETVTFRNSGCNSLLTKQRSTDQGSGANSTYDTDIWMVNTVQLVLSRAL